MDRGPTLWPRDNLFSQEGFFNQRLIVLLTRRGRREGDCHVGFDCHLTSPAILYGVLFLVCRNAFKTDPFILHALPTMLIISVIEFLI